MMQKARAWIAKNKNAPDAMDMKSVPPLKLEHLIEHMDEAGVEKAIIIGAKGYMRKSLTGRWKDKGNVWEVPNEDNKVTSVLKVRTSGVIKADDPLKRFDVDLILERPMRRT